MGYYDVMQVCLNGHQITDHYNELQQHRKDFCGNCGAKTIHACPKCNEPIRGDYVIPNVIGGGPTSIPSHCHKCGAKYPWATKINKTIKFPRVHIPNWVTRNLEKIVITVIITVLLAWLGLR